MNKLLFLLLILLFSLLCSCDSGSDNNEPVKEPEKTPSGWWRSAGLIPNGDIYKWGNGLTKITHSKDYIFVMDAATVDDGSKPGYLRANHNIFMSKQGTETWDTLKLPQNSNPLSFYGDSSGLYVGSYISAKIWHYEPETKKWTDMKALELAGHQVFNVYGISRLNGQLIASLAGYNDTTEADKIIIGPILLQQPDGTWKDIAPPNPARLEDPIHLRKNPLQFFIAREWRGDLFAATADEGVWRYSSVSGEWSMVPNPNRANWSFEYNGKHLEEHIPQAITVHKNKFYMAGRAGGIYILNEDFKSWTSIDSIRTEQTSLRSIAPLVPYTLASDGKHLFVSGVKSGIPAVYMGDINPDEPKG